MKLTREFASALGVFGKLSEDDGTKIAATLEHAYRFDCDVYTPKLPAGEYVCVRGVHRLEKVVGPFETFEITNVPGHTGILFHIGNFNFDSDGCVLLGKVFISDRAMVSQSELAFHEFMHRLSGISTFNLTVS